MRFNSTQYASSQDSIRAIYVPVPVCFLAEESHWLSSKQTRQHGAETKKTDQGWICAGGGGGCGVVAIKIEHDILVSDQANL